MTWEILLLFALLMTGAVILGIMAHRGRLSYGWALAALAGAAAVLSRLAGRQDVRIGEPPSSQPGASVAKPVLDVVDNRAEEERGRIRDAEADPDRVERLERLADINDRGRE